MAANEPNMQDEYLSLLLKEQTAVTVFLVNGIRLEGTVKGFDKFSLLLHGHAVLQLVYKHAISAVLPTAGVLSPAGARSATGR